MRFYRMSSTSEDPQRLLTPLGQWTEPWGASEHGEPCEKCERTGRVAHECWSCLLSGADADCPACAGAVRWRADCPVCRGSGRIDGRPRHGVSVFPRVRGLYRYMLAKGADLDRCVILELEAQLADDVDFDADQGALLVLPSKVLASLRLERDVLDEVRRGAAGARSPTSG